MQPTVQKDGLEGSHTPCPSKARIMLVLSCPAFKNLKCQLKKSKEILRVYEFHGVNNWKEFGSIQRIHFHSPPKWPLFLIKANYFILSSFSKEKNGVRIKERGNLQRNKKRLLHNYTKCPF